MVCNFSSLVWPDGSAPAALASLLFEPPEPQIIGKTQCFATFLPFRASASSFFWLFLFSDLLSSNLSLLSASALLCFSSVHIVGSLTSKLPSTSNWWLLLVNGLMDLPAFSPRYGRLPNGVPIGRWSTFKVGLPYVNLLEGSWRGDPKTIQVIRWLDNFRVEMGVPHLRKPNGFIWTLGARRSDYHPFSDVHCNYWIYRMFGTQIVGWMGMIPHPSQANMAKSTVQAI